MSKTPRFAPTILFALAYALAMFHRTAFSEIAGALEAGTGLSVEGAAWVGSSFFWVYLIAQIPVGVLVDAAGSRLVGATGSAAMAAGSALFACSTHPWAFGAARGLCAAGAVSVFLALLAHCGRAYGSRSSSALGKVLFFGNLGGAAAGAPLAWALESMGFRGVYWILACASAAACVATLLWPDSEHRKEKISTALRHTLPSFLRAAHHTDVYLGAGAMAGLAGAFHAFSGFGTHRFASMLGLGPEGAGFLITSMVLGFATGTWAWGRLGDRRALRAVSLRMAPVAALAAWTALTLSPPAHASALAALLFAAGAACGAFCNVYALLDDLTEPGARGGVKAAANCGIALGAAVIQVAQGALPPELAAMPCLAACLLGSLCCWSLSRRASAQATTNATTAEADPSPLEAATV